MITSLILILATVSLASVFFFWGLGYLGQSESATGASINQSTLKSQEQFSIDTVRFWSSTAASPTTLVSSGDMITVYIRNFGGIPITIDHVYVTYLSSTVLFQANSAISTCGSGVNCFTTYSSSTTSASNCIPASLPPTFAQAPPVTISANAEKCTNLQISATSLVSWSVGNTYTILIASTRGNQYSASFTVPVQDFG